jgi:catechol 2,3-dioxygenase-like lactoylglutathione lyase family enzyme
MSQAAKSQIDPMNRKNYGAISPMLAVADIEKAYEFCQKAFGFEGRGIMPGPDDIARAIFACVVSPTSVAEL